MVSMTEDPPPNLPPLRGNAFRVEDVGQPLR
jgi:hypothetical protein